MPAIHIAQPRTTCHLRIDWLERAALLPGKGLHVAIVLMMAANHSRSSSIILTRYPLHRFGISRDAGYDALTRLVQAGLISVSRQRGRVPCVTLIDPHNYLPMVLQA